MTYVPTSSGFVYLAVVVDGWSGRVIGYASEDGACAGSAEHGDWAATARRSWPETGLMGSALPVRTRCHVEPCAGVHYRLNWCMLL